MGSKSVLGLSYLFSRPLTRDRTAVHPPTHTDRPADELNQAQQPIPEVSLADFALVAQL